jgi:hypothetical protein
MAAFSIERLEGRDAMTAGFLSCAAFDGTPIDAGLVAVGRRFQESSNAPLDPLSFNLVVTDGGDEEESGGNPRLCVVL